MGHRGTWTMGIAIALGMATAACEQPAEDDLDPSRYASEHAGVDTEVRCIVGEPLEFLPGDADRDGTVGIGDLSYLIAWLYHGGPRPNLEASDVNTDGQADLTDAIAVYEHVEAGAPLPAGSSPMPSCQTELAAARRDPGPGEMSCGPPSSPTLVMAEEVPGAPGATVVASHAGGCESVLSWEGPSGSIVIDATPRSYVTAAAGYTAAGAFVCASVATTAATPLRTESDDAILRVDAVDVLCAHAPDPVGPWTEMQVLPVPNGGAAAWVAGATVDDVASLEWIRDSRFNPSDLRRDGRPSTDGFWRTEIEVGPAAVGAVASTQLEPMPFGFEGGDGTEMIDTLVDVE